MKWSFSKLQIREEGMNNDGFSVFCCNTGAMFLQAQARAEQCESWILSKKKREGGMSLDRFVFLLGSLRLCNIRQGWAM
jgi:hypothetical protein